MVVILIVRQSTFINYPCANIEEKKHVDFFLTIDHSYTH